MLQESQETSCDSNNNRIEHEANAGSVIPIYLNGACN